MSATANRPVDLVTLYVGAAAPSGGDVRPDDPSS